MENLPHPRSPSQVGGFAATLSTHSSTAPRANRIYLIPLARPAPRSMDIGNVRERRTKESKEMEKGKGFSVRFAPLRPFNFEGRANPDAASSPPRPTSPNLRKSFDGVEGPENDRRQGDGQPLHGKLFARFPVVVACRHPPLKHVGQGPQNQKGVTAWGQSSGGNCGQHRQVQPNNGRNWSSFPMILSKPARRLENPTGVKH